MKECKRRKKKWKSRCARSGSRTRTAITGPGAVSPSCLPFHHSGGFSGCKGKGKWWNFQQFSLTFTDFYVFITWFLRFPVRMGDMPSACHADFLEHREGG